MLKTTVSGLFLHGLLDANLFNMAAKQHSLSQSGQGLSNQAAIWNELKLIIWSLDRSNFDLIG